MIKRFARARERRRSVFVPKIFWNSASDFFAGAHGLLSMCCATWHQRVPLKQARNAENTYRKLNRTTWEAHHHAVMRAKA
jgi:hypothetical protein